MPWYTTEDARRDALKQAAEKERVGGVEAKSGAINPACSSFCAVGEPCAITADGRCDAELTHNAEVSGAGAASAGLPGYAAAAAGKEMK